MSAIATTEFLEILLAIGLFIWFFYGPWQSFLIDTTRQKLFEIRDSLFVLAAEGNLEFDSDVYLILRKRINILIRLCHKVSFWRFIIFNVLDEIDESKEKTESLFDITSKIENEALRNEIQKKIYSITSVVVVSIAFRSLFLLAIVFLIMFPIFILRDLLGEHYNRIKCYFVKVGSNIEKEITMDSHKAA
jgi:hypothetical protein